MRNAIQLRQALRNRLPILGRRPAGKLRLRCPQTQLRKRHHHHTPDQQREVPRSESKSGNKNYQNRQKRSSSKPLSAAARDDDSGPSAVRVRYQLRQSDVSLRLPHRQFPGAVPIRVRREGDKGKGRVRGIRVAAVGDVPRQHRCSS